MHKNKQYELKLSPRWITRSCTQRVGKWLLCTDDECKKHIGEKLSNHCYSQYEAVWQYCSSPMWTTCRNNDCKRHVYAKREMGTFSGPELHWNRVKTDLQPWRDCGGELGDWARYFSGACRKHECRKLELGYMPLLLTKNY